MRDYQKDFRRRLPLVKELYGLGLSVHEIAEIITEWSEATLSKDVARIGGAKGFSDRPKKQADVFVAVIRRYVKIEALDNQFAEDELRDALATWLRVDLIFAMIYGIESTLDQLVHPSFPPNRERHAHLLGAIFKVEISDESRDAEFSHKELIEMWWQNLLIAINSGEEQVPQSREQLCKMEISRALFREQADIMPIWDESVFQLLDDMMLILTEQEHSVIIARYGLGVEKRTLEQISENMHCSRGYVHQVEKKAIRKLRKEARKRQIEVIGCPVGNVLQREFKKRETTKKVASLNVKSEPVINPNHFVRVDDLELSTRARNCMINGDIVLVGELVQMTEHDCLKMKNFGRKVMSEIKVELARLGLTLGMRTSDGLNALITQCVQNQNTPRYL